MLRNWFRIDARTLVKEEPGKLSEREQALYRRRDGQKGAYTFEYNPGTGTTMVQLVEHPEW